ncbi:MAG TPA: glycosyltransferase family 4 protein, partial [bacterium]|nr:glycosyltransferase family 4 protein [bacterium]
RADRIQAISNFLAERAKKLGAKNKIEVMPNGITISNFKFHPPWVTDKSPIQNSKKIITASRLVKKNGIKYLIQAFQLLVTDCSLPVTLTIIGDGPLRPRLEKLAKDLKIDQRVEFVGNIPNQQVYEHLSQADIFCRPSLSEGLGNAFLEAMAVKVPTVATPVGGIPDFLKDGETGWFCKVKDPASIAEKINYILNPTNKEEAERVIENAYNLVMKKYNWNDIARNIKGIFSELINQA